MCSISINERLRPLIVWLGLTELAWIGYWLLKSGNATPGYVATVVAWIVAMLAWLVIATYLGTQGFFLKHSERLSNLIGVAAVVTFGVVMFGLIPAAREGLLSAARNTSDLQLISIHILGCWPSEPSSSSSTASCHFTS